MADPEVEGVAAGVMVEAMEVEEEEVVMAAAMGVAATVMVAAMKVDAGMVAAALGVLAVSTVVKKVTWPGTVTKEEVAAVHVEAAASVTPAGSLDILPGIVPLTLVECFRVWYFPFVGLYGF